MRNHMDYVHGRAIVREIGESVAETRTGTTGQTQNANRRAPRIGGAVTLNRLRCQALWKNSALSHLGQQ